MELRMNRIMLYEITYEIISFGNLINYIKLI